MLSGYWVDSNDSGQDPMASSWQNDETLASSTSPNKEMYGNTATV
jgi:hypothetical protein